jgi:hypothetical protein
MFLPNRIKVFNRVDPDGDRDLVCDIESGVRVQDDLQRHREKDTTIFQAMIREPGKNF